MTRITVSGELGRQLTDVQSCIELCDDAGHTIGYFTPAVEILPGPSISNEELDRRENCESIYRTEEVLARLRKL